MKSLLTPRNVLGLPMRRHVRNQAEQPSLVELSASEWDAFFRDDDAKIPSLEFDSAVALHVLMNEGNFCKTTIALAEERLKESGVSDPRN